MLGLSIARYGMNPAIHPRVSRAISVRDTSVVTQLSSAVIQKVPNCIYTMDTDVNVRFLQNSCSVCV